MNIEMPTPNELAQRYKNKFRESGVAEVVRLMNKHGVTIQDIQNYQRSKDSNIAPLEKIREHKLNGRPPKSKESKVSGTVSNGSPTVNSKQADKPTSKNSSFVGTKA